MNRRLLLASALAGWAAPAWYALAGRTTSAAARPAEDKNGRWRHGISKFGNLKYPADFKNFDYVKVDAPKSGVVRQAVLGTYDNLNPVVADIKGTLAAGIELISDTLLAPAAIQ